MKTLSANTKRKPGAFSRWLSRLAKANKPANTFTKPKTKAKPEAPVDYTEKLEEIKTLKAQLKDKELEIAGMQERLDGGGDVALTIASLGFEPSQLPVVETADESMTRSELWDVYNSLSLEEKNSFYSKHRKEMMTWKS